MDIIQKQVYDPPKAIELIVPCQTCVQEVSESLFGYLDADGNVVEMTEEQSAMLDAAILEKMPAGLKN